MEAVYPIGPGSLWQDNELRYSLRSLVKHAPEVDRVLLVGRLPKWMDLSAPSDIEIVHLEHADKGTRCGNQLAKMKLAMEYLSGGQFVWMNDDFYLLHAQDWQAVHHIPHPSHRTPYYQQCYQSARTFLFSMGIAPPRDHELHVPVMLDAHKAANVLEIVPSFDIAFRTVYFNMHAPVSTPILDVKLHAVRDVEHWRSFSSSTSVVRNDRFRKMIDRLYPDPTPWEMV